MKNIISFLVIGPLFQIMAYSQPLPASMVFGIGTYNTGTSWAAASVQHIAGVEFHQSQGVLRYSFRINGPSLISTPVDVSYYLDNIVSLGWDGPATSAESAALAIATAIIRVKDPAATELASASVSTSITGLQQVQTGQLGPGTLQLMLSTNKVYEIELIASTYEQANFNVSPSFHSFASAYSDPYISISSAAQTAGYSLQFSAGIANVALPELSSLMLFAVGLASILAYQFVFKFPKPQLENSKVRSS